MLSPQQKKNYLKAPSKCPYCQSDEITAQSFDADSEGGSQPVNCDECHASWVDVYQLVDVI